MATSYAMPPPGPPAWQVTLKQRLEERQAADSVHAELIAQYRHLAVCLRESKERNRAWLNTKSSGISGTSGGGDGGPATRSYIATLEKQLSSLRTDLSILYKANSTSQARQLALSDTLRERDDEIRRLSDELRSANDARERAARRERDNEERWRMKEADVQTLHDEVLSLTLELNQVTARNAALQTDNASLLQRWLDKMNERADAMNENFEREEREKRDKGKAPEV